MVVCVILGGGLLKGAAVATHATGAFDVKLTPQTTDNDTEGTALGRMSIDKTYHGELEATGKGEMLTAGSSVMDSGLHDRRRELTQFRFGFRLRRDAASAGPRSPTLRNAPRPFPPRR